jgi:hypothetical protein
MNTGKTNPNPAMARLQDLSNAFSYSGQLDMLGELLQPITSQLKEYELLPDTHTNLAGLVFLFSSWAHRDKTLSDGAAARLMQCGAEAVQMALELPGAGDPAGLVEQVLQTYRSLEAVPLAVRWLLAKEADLQRVALAGLPDLEPDHLRPVLERDDLGLMEEDLREAVKRMEVAAPWTTVVGQAAGLPARVAWYRSEAGPADVPQNLDKWLDSRWTAARQVAMLLYRQRWYDLAEVKRRRGEAVRFPSKAMDLFAGWPDPQNKWANGRLVRGQLVLAVLDPEEQADFLQAAAFTIAGSAGKLYPEVLAWASNKGHEGWFAEYPVKGPQSRVDLPRVVGGWPALYREITGREPGTRDSARLQTLFQALRAGRMPGLPDNVDATLLNYAAVDGRGRGQVGYVDVTLYAMALPNFQSIKDLPEDYRLTQPQPPWPGGGAFVLGATHLEAGERWLWIHLARHFQANAKEALRLCGVRLGPDAIDSLAQRLCSVVRFTRGNVETCIAGWVAMGALELVATDTYRLTHEASWRHVEDMARLKADRAKQAAARRNRSLGRTKQNKESRAW